MEIRFAKTAGFCFGVKRAVDLTYGLLNEGCKVATLGPLIHNPQAVEDMQKKGALVADALADVQRRRRLHAARGGGQIHQVARHGGIVIG